MLDSLVLIADLCHSKVILEKLLRIVSQLSDWTAASMVKLKHVKDGGTYQRSPTDIVHQPYKRMH